LIHFSGFYSFRALTKSVDGLHCHTNIVVLLLLRPTCNVFLWIFRRNPTGFGRPEPPHGDMDQTTVPLFTFQRWDTFFFFLFYLGVVRSTFIFSPRLVCRNDENQFRVCAPLGNRTNTPPVSCQPIYHCIPIYYKISFIYFILFDDEHTTKPIDSLLLFIYIYFASSPVYVLI